MRSPTLFGAGLILGALYLGWKIFQITKLQTTFTGISIGPTGNLYFNFAFYNNSAEPIEINSLAGTVFYLGDPVAAVASNNPAAIPPNSTVDIPVSVSLNLLNLGANFSNLVNQGISTGLIFQGQLATNIGSIYLNRNIGS